MYWTSAQNVADALGNQFLRSGQFSAAAGPTEMQTSASPAAASTGSIYAPVDGSGFAGLSVQSVGFEDGVDNAKVHIYLTKGSASLIRKLPKKVSNIDIKIHKMGPINVRPELSGASTNYGNIYEKNGRVCCGSSCAPTSENIAGTFGALVSQVGSKDIYILSNNHVLGGCNHTPKGQPILSPANMDGRPNARAPGEIGRHDRVAELRSGDPQFVPAGATDLALAVVSNASNVSSWQGDPINGFDTPSNGIPPQSRLRVKKFGRTTGLTTGVIEARILVPAPITYSAKSFKSVVWFKDVWTVKSDAGSAFALSGDSGSLVVTEDGRSAVGVVFAASANGEYAWIIPITDVVRTLGGIELLSGHGT